MAIVIDKLFRGLFQDKESFRKNKRVDMILNLTSCFGVRNFCGALLKQKRG